MERHTEIIDQAQQVEQQNLKHALAHRKPYRKLEHTGFCHHCEAEVEAPKLFCDGKCSTRWSRSNEF